MSNRLRHHINPLSSKYAAFRVEALDLPADRPLEIEVGCADAMFLFERAKTDPDRFYLGLEIRPALVDEVNRRALEQGVPVKAVFCNANLHLSTLLAGRLADRVFLNFPDPWFKRRHHKRRMIDRVLIDQMAGAVAPGGDLFVQTDVWDLALDALSLLETETRDFRNLAGEWSFWKEDNPYGARSWREVGCIERERKIWRILYRRIVDGQPPRPA
jgi:tRNA (guanine-N7-)-methyltransferase